jgi:hypothetical protein
MLPDVEDHPEFEKNVGFFWMWRAVQSLRFATRIRCRFVCPHSVNAGCNLALENGGSTATCSLGDAMGDVKMEDVRSV